MSNEGQMMRHPVSGEVHERTRLCDKRGCRPAPPPRDLNPYEWDLNAFCKAVRETNVSEIRDIAGFARWLWAVTGLPFTFGDTPDTVTVELPRKDAEFFARHKFTSSPNAAVSTACRAALGGEQK